LLLSSKREKQFDILDGFLEVAIGRKHRSMGIRLVYDGFGFVGIVPEIRRGRLRLKAG
jgi:hypothetical protein